MEGRGRGIEKIGEREENWRRERQRKGGKWNDREREEGTGGEEEVRRKAGRNGDHGLLHCTDCWRIWLVTSIHIILFFAWF